MMSEIVIEVEEDNVTIPSKDIRTFYFINNQLFIQTENENYKLTTFAQKQFFYHLSLRWGTRLNQKRDILIASAIHNRAVKEKHSLVFRKLRYYKDHVRVGSVVTTKYIEIPVGEVREKFESVLKTLKIQYELFSTHETLRTDFYSYEISSIETHNKDKIISDLTLCVGHSGVTSIQVRVGFVVQKCGNRMLGYRFAREIHKGETKEQILESLRKVTISALKHLEPTLKKISQVGTLSDVGTHEDISKTQKPKLQTHAFRILEAKA